ncbi:MAG: hypothetical protein LUF33_01820 [Clostridiales bacterium]|nr:hypothetical protein [Clostridiales bacterium]
MPHEICCPQCGNRDLQVQTITDVKSEGKNFSGTKGCLGYILFGPLGLLCGSCGQKEKITTTNSTYWTCPKCGKKFRAPEELQKEIEVNKKAFVGQAVLGVIIAIICVIALYSSTGLGLALITGIIVLAMTVGGFYLMTRSKNKKIEAELQQLEEDMQRFLQ